MRSFSQVLLVTSIAVGCGGNDPATVDAPKAVDAAPPTVVAVTCPASPPATITASTGTYSPTSATINQGQSVKFTMPGTHDVTPNSTASDSGLKVNFGETKCLMFTQTGTFGFHCSVHAFTGSIVVQ